VTERVPAGSVARCGHGGVVIAKVFSFEKNVKPVGLLLIDNLYSAMLCFVEVIHICPCEMRVANLIE
jgi:hypothetical protein